MAKLPEEVIHELAAKGRLAFKKHCALRMYERKIYAIEVMEAMQCCKIIEGYPEDYPLPSGLVLGHTQKSRPIHAVVAVDEKEPILWIITAYQPNLLEWDESFEKRRRKG